MSERSSLERLLLVVGVLVAAVLAGILGAHAGDVPQPSVPKAVGGACVAPPDVMRRDHMAMLKHGRDLSVRAGERVEGGRLTGCISCHAVSGGKGGAVTVSSSQHFCRACHDYAAVKIDCFECHASRPEQAIKATDGGVPPTGAHAALADYAREIAR
jgi:predicted CXXCH cytochrome family protein